MKTTISVFILLLFSTITFSQTSTNKFIVGDVLTSKINNVEILKSPDESSEILMKINKEEEIIYLGEDKNAYSKIKIKNVDGWIDSSFLINSKKDNLKQINSYKKIDNWIFTANTSLNAKANSNIIKIIEDNGQIKNALVGQLEIEIYKGVLLVFKDSINDIGIKEFRNALDKVFPFKMGKNTYSQYIGTNGKKFSIYISVELEAIIETPIGKREVFLIETVNQGDDLDPLGKSKNYFDRRVVWVDKELLIPWGRRVYGDLYGESFIGRGGFYIIDVSGN